MDTNKLIRKIYYVVKRLSNAFAAFYKELIKPIEFLKGEDFERCLRSRVFTKEKFDLVMKTHDFHENNQDYVESSLFPDYLFREKKTNKTFFVEAKYRAKTYQGKVQWCKPYQFIRYRKYISETPVLIAIGLGGRPDNPKQIFLVPLEKIEYCSLYPNSLVDYEFTGRRSNLLDMFRDKIYDLSI
jgi:hypothetical protein